jgi:ABC-type transport system involved in multi-copper enzyme maturation permease subunit
MTGFILKDLLTLRRYMKLIALAIVVFAAMTWYLDNAAVVTAMIAVQFAMLPVTTFSYDHLAKWELFAQTLPVSRREIVASKYVLSIAFIALGTIIGIGLALVVGLLKDEPADPRDLALMGGFIVAASLFFHSVMIPLIYKFGVEKSRFMLLAVAGAAALIAALMNLPAPDWLMKASPFAMLGAALAGAAALMAVSFFISGAIYEARDL